eukprot:g7268.t1
MVHEQQPEIDVVSSCRDNNDASNAPVTSDGEDGVDSLPAEVWMARAGGSMQRRFPAYATLAERVQRGNDLVKAVRAGRSFRKATFSSMKGALEIGLWAATRPDEFMRKHKAFRHDISKLPAGRAPNSPGQPGRMTIKANVSGDRDSGGAEGASNSSRAQMGASSGGDIGVAGSGDSDRVRVLEAKVQKELKALMKAYLQRQVSLDNALSESITQREFDWDADMRRMMNTVKIAAAGEGKRTFESVPKVMRRQVAANKRSEEAKSLQGSWFPSVMKRTLAMVQGKDGGEMPRCMTKLAAALHKVLSSGHTVTPYIFWSLVDASFLAEDHERPPSQKMILLCLSSVHQRPENYHRFLVDNGIKVPTSLKQAFQRAHQKRAHRKGGSKKSQLGGGSANRLSGVVVGGGDHPLGGALDDRHSSNMSVVGGALRYGGGGGGASTANLSDGGASDDMSDTMSVFSVSTLLEGF